MYKSLNLLILLLLASCQGTPEKALKTLHVNFQEGDPPSLHPYHLLSVRGRCLGKLLFEGLTRVDEEGQPQLAGAKEVAISACQTQYTFTLRSNSWSNGEPVTAFHYERAWKEAIASNSTCVRSYLFYIIKHAKAAKKGEMPLGAVGVRALNTNTLFVELAFPAPYFLELLSQHPFAPLAGSVESSLFNGPFKVDEWKKGRSLTLKPNPFFWDRENIHLDTIEFSFVQNAMTTLSMFKKKQLDWVGEPFSRLTSEMIASLQKTEGLSHHQVSRCFWIYFNTTHPFFTSPLIRQALSLAIDRSAITDHILVGDLPLYTPLPYSLTLSTSQPLKCNVDRAKQLFEAGIKELGLTPKTLPPITLSYYNSEGYRQVNEYLQQLWQETFNISVTLEGKEWNVFCSDLRSGQFHIGGASESVLYKDPIGLLERFEIDEPSNISLWKHTLYQDKIDKSRRCPESEKRRELLKEAEQIIIDESPYIPISNRVHFYTHSPYLKGFIIDHSGCVDFSRAFLESEQK